MYLGDLDFSTNVYVVKITSTYSGYHLESFDSKSLCLDLHENLAIF